MKVVRSFPYVSVDGVAAKIAALLREQKKEQYLEKGKVLRYGFVRDEELSKDPHTSAYNYALGHSAFLRQEMDRLNRDKEKAKAIHGKTAKEVVELETKNQRDP